MNEKIGKGRIQHRWMDWSLIPGASIDTKEESREDPPELGFAGYKKRWREK